MAKRDVWVRVGDDLVRGDHIVGITVGRTPYPHETFKLLTKATGHRDPLIFDTDVLVGDRSHQGHLRVTAPPTTS
ncbi:hypothetical protein [Streptacidiphilus sp. PAMC 29251]